MLLLHILAALASLASSGLCALRPSARKFNISYLLVGLTLSSGTYLVLIRPAHIMSVCLSGLVYLGVVSASLAIANYRFS